jgi:starvation-inducible outer membrane lipoprotein
MRWFSFMMILAMALAGCASQPANVAPQPQAHLYSPANATALTFDPPVIAGSPQLDLSRDGRGEAAFSGFYDGTTTYYSISTYDLDPGCAGGFGGGWASGYYQRQAITQTNGISYR